LRFLSGWDKRHGEGSSAELRGVMTALHAAGKVAA
jgi:hypothetical protein